MPAKDLYHDSVVAALQKDGWIVQEQYQLAFLNRLLYIDLRAIRDQEQRVIFIEIKPFQNIQSPVAYFQSMIGQYTLYRSILDEVGITSPLFVAVPLIIYSTLLQEDFSRFIIRNFAIPLLIFDPGIQEIVEWIP
jgi:hypothetical protein